MNDKGLVLLPRGLSYFLWHHWHPIPDGQFESWLLCYRSSSLWIYLGRLQIIAQVLGLLTPLWETKWSSWVTWLLRPFGSETADRKSLSLSLICLSMSLCHSNKLTNKSLKMKMNEKKGKTERRDQCLGLSACPCSARITNSLPSQH